jgi:hypothetical protein
MQATIYTHHFYLAAAPFCRGVKRTRWHHPMETWYQEALLENALLESSYSCSMMPLRLLIELHFV